MLIKIAIKSKKSFEKKNKKIKVGRHETPLTLVYTVKNYNKRGKVNEKKKFNIYIFIIIIKDNSSFECLKTIIWINGIMMYFVSYSTSFHNIYNPNSNIFLFNLFFVSISISLTYSNRHTCKWHFYVTCLSQAASVCSQTYTHTPTKKKTKANK